nr:hypothetical protein [Lachnospiraceae bacterium]
DWSDPHHEAHKRVTEETLRDLDVEGIPRLLVRNKADLYEDGLNRKNHPGGDKFNISARTGYGIDDLLDALQAIFDSGNRVVDICLPYSEGSMLDRIHREARVISESFKEDGIYISADCPAALADLIESRGREEDERVG